MKSKQIHKDEMLGDLMAKTNLDQPGEDFTKKIMARLEESSLVSNVLEQPLISLKLWVLIGFAFATLVVTVFFIDFSFLEGMFSGISIERPKVFDFFRDIANGVAAWFSGVKLSSVTIMILVSISLLVLIERLLRKARTTSTTMV